MRTRRSWIIATAVAATMMLAVGSSAMRPRCTHVEGDEHISIPLAQIAHGAVAFFCYRDQAGDRLRFILARDEDGKIHSVLDACRQCYSYYKGYTSSGGELVCRLCGNRYKLKTMEKGQASCVPVALPATQHGGTIEVKVADLRRSKALF